MTLEEALNQLSERQKQRIRAVWAAHEEGKLTRDELIRVATNIVLAGNAVGYTLGVNNVIRIVEKVAGKVELAQPEPDGRHVDDKRISEALGTIMVDDGTDRAMQLERLADNEPKAAAADGSRDALRRSKRVKGWTRSLEADACQLCLWWWREGRTWQPDHPMPRHTGCTCTQTPVVTTTENYQSEEQAAHRRRERRRA